MNTREMHQIYDALANLIIIGLMPAREQYRLLNQIYRIGYRYYDHLGAYETLVEMSDASMQIKSAAWTTMYDTLRMKYLAALSHV